MNVRLTLAALALLFTAGCATPFVAGDGSAHLIKPLQRCDLENGVTVYVEPATGCDPLAVRKADAPTQSGVAVPYSFTPARTVMSPTPTPAQPSARATASVVAQAGPASAQATASSGQSNAQRQCTSGKVWKRLNWFGHPQHEKHVCMAPDDPHVFPGE